MAEEEEDLVEPWMLHRTLHGLPAFARVGQAASE
jgi:hypothetical protein